MSPALTASAEVLRGRLNAAELKWREEQHAWGDLERALLLVATEGSSICLF